ncbi:MAG: Maf family protein [Acidobacteriota bacterium]
MQTPPSTVQLVLASGSPRRRRLLEDLGVSFRICPVHTDESPKDGESIAEMVLRLPERRPSQRNRPDAWFWRRTPWSFSTASDSESPKTKLTHVQCCGGWQEKPIPS